MTFLPSQQLLITADAKGKLYRCTASLSEPSKPLGIDLGGPTRLASIGRSNQVLAMTGPQAVVVDVDSAKTVPHALIESFDPSRGDKFVVATSGTAQLASFSAQGEMKSTRLSVEPAATFQVGASLLSADIAGSRLLAGAARGAVLFDADGGTSWHQTVAPRGQVDRRDAGVQRRLGGTL